MFLLHLLFLFIMYHYPYPWQVLVPFQHYGGYCLYSFDIQKRIVAILQDTPSNRDHTAPLGYCRYYNDMLQKVCRIFDRVMELLSEEWNDDSYDWRRIVVHDPSLLVAR